MIDSGKKHDPIIQQEDIIHIQGEAKETRGKFDFRFMGGNPVINFSGDFRALGCSIFFWGMSILGVLCSAVVIIVGYILMAG